MKRVRTAVRGHAEARRGQTRGDDASLKCRSAQRGAGPGTQGGWGQPPPPATLAELHGPMNEMPLA